VSETPAYRRAVGQVYRDALDRALAGAAGIESEWWALLRAHSRAGLCNGFAFGRSGLEYLGAGGASADVADVATVRGDVR
jgi:hypothetical protein